MIYCIKHRKPIIHALGCKDCLTQYSEEELLLKGLAKATENLWNKINKDLEKL